MRLFPLTPFMLCNRTQTAILIMVCHSTIGYCDNIGSYVCFVNRFLKRRSFYIFEASCGAGAQSVTIKPTGCGFDPHSRRWNIYLNLYFHFFPLVSRQSAALSSATQHAMPPESPDSRFSKQSEERSVLTLGCLPCAAGKYVDTFIHLLQLIYVVSISVGRQAYKSFDVAWRERMA